MTQGRSLIACLLWLAVAFLAIPAEGGELRVLEAEVEFPGLNRLALVVGNSEYEAVPALENARMDARAMAEKARKLGYDVHLVENADRLEMNRAINDFLLEIEPGAEVLFYYAGHGVELDGTNYLIPVDLPMLSPDQERLLRTEAVGLAGLLRDLESRSARVNLVVLDACRDNPFARSGTRSLGSTRGLGRVDPPSGTFVMFSAGAGEAALDSLGPGDENPNGLFTRHLLALMEREGMELRDMVRKLRQEVRLEARAASGHSQTPSYYDQLLGDFYFHPPQRGLQTPAQAGNDKTACEILVQEDAPPELVLFNDYTSIIAECGRVAARNPENESLAALLAEAREQQAFQRALTSSTPVFARAYLRLFPDGGYRAEVEEYLASLDPEFSVAAAAPSREIDREPAEAAEPQPPTAAPTEPASPRPGENSAPVEPEALPDGPALAALSPRTGPAPSEPEAVPEPPLTPAVPPPAEAGTEEDASLVTSPPTDAPSVPSAPAAADEALARGTVQSLSRSGAAASPPPLEDPRAAEPNDADFQLAARPPQPGETAALAPQAEPEPDPVEIVRALQEELKRAGCYDAAIDGIWGPRSRKAVREFGRHAAVEIASTDPTAELLERVGPFDRRVCPIVCEPGYEREGDRCIAAPVREPVRDTATAPVQDTPQAPSSGDTERPRGEGELQAFMSPEVAPSRPTGRAYGAACISNEGRYTVVSGRPDAGAASQAARAKAGSCPFFLEFSGSVCFAIASASNPLPGYPSYWKAASRSGEANARAAARQQCEQKGVSCQVSYSVCASTHGDTSGTVQRASAPRPVEQESSSARKPRKSLTDKWGY